MWWLLLFLSSGCAFLYGAYQRDEEGKTRRKGSLDLLPVDQAVVIDLAIAALKVGVSVPLLLKILEGALAEEKRPPNLARVGQLLDMGSSWKEAWDGVGTRFFSLRDALEPAWVDGIAGIPLLERTALRIRVRRVQRSKEAAAKLGTKLVMPLGLCFLPSFMMLGVLPVIASAGFSLFGL